MVYLKVKSDYCPYLWELSCWFLFQEDGRMDDWVEGAAAQSSLKVAIWGGHPAEVQRDFSGPGVGRLGFLAQALAIPGSCVSDPTR